MSLEQTKGKFKLEGKVVGINNENSFREGYTKADKHYKSLSFFVETSLTNRVRVELFGQERDEVVAFNNNEKDEKKKKKYVKWDERHNDHGSHKVLGMNLYIEKDNKGKNKRKVLVEYDAVDYIQEQLNDGDFVRINGEINFQNYVDNEGNKRESYSLSIRSISKIDEIDFESEDFKEVAMFEQEIVIDDTMVDQETKKLIISAKTIAYNKDVIDATFYVDGEKLPKLANNMSKRLSFGDFIKVYGKVVNSKITKEADEDDIDMGDDDDWGGDKEIEEEMNKTYIIDFVSELQITSVDSKSYEEKKYNEDDLISKDEEIFEGSYEDDGEGDPFNDDEGEPIDIDDDDLPF